MGQGEPQAADSARIRLMQTARAMVLRGDNNFSIAELCDEAQVDRNTFRAHFSGRTALMAALMYEQTSDAAPIVAAPSTESQPEPETPKVEQEPSVSTPDAWLERRLRVFERALTALESRAEATARDQARVIAQMEEKLAALSGEPIERRLQSHQPAQEGPVPVSPAPLALAPMQVRHRDDAAPVQEQDDFEDASAGAEQPPRAENVQQEEVRPSVAEAMAVPPLVAVTISKEEMADVLQSARARARAAATVSDSENQPKDKSWRARWLAIGGLSLMVLFLCIGLTLGNTGIATRDGRAAEWHGSGNSQRHVAQGALARTIASADYGDATAEARLALAYLRGLGVARDASAALRWSTAAAEAGEPVAQYLLGALYQQGEVVKADPRRAFAWFAMAAAHGNLKAMHNLAIAYAEGLGTPKDEAKAAQWFMSAAERGYVDSAFDLAVMYERGTGVPQNPLEALKWYEIAAHAGDQQSKARVDFLRGQMSADDAKRAADAATAFEPLPALPAANTL